AWAWAGEGAGAWAWAGAGAGAGAGENSSRRDRHSPRQASATIPTAMPPMIAGPVAMSGGRMRTQRNGRNDGTGPPASRATGRPSVRIAPDRHSHPSRAISGRPPRTDRLRARVVAATGPRTVIDISLTDRPRESPVGVQEGDGQVRALDVGVVAQARERDRGD